MIYTFLIFLIFYSMKHNELQNLSSKQHFCNLICCRIIKDKVYLFFFLRKYEPSPAACKSDKKLQRSFKVEQKVRRCKIPFSPSWDKLRRSWRRPMANSLHRVQFLLNKQSITFIWIKLTYSSCSWHLRF